ncbi:DeoR/GlpR family DNA-binding transcription regulator [Diplocloster hominis]|uniref:DeoR/GlpR family DNA-binding transcription regulator n=1 Tax=Diplocloster hominis TaxID=3079010 RepID=UPI0031BAC09C
MQEKVKRQMDLVLEYIAARDFVPVQKLMSDLDMSKSTVNRYLKYLEAEHKVRRMYGGVTASVGKPETCNPPASSGSDSPRIRIGKQAATMAEDHDIIFVGTGKTCFELYKSLEAHDLIVFTNNIYCAAYRNPNVSHIYILGGEVFDANVVLGSLGIENLSKINPNKIFFSASAINDRFEIQYNYDVERQYIETLMDMEGKKIFLINSAKQNRQSPFKIDCLGGIDAFVTDIPISSEDQERFRSLNTVIIPV